MCGEKTLAVQSSNSHQGSPPHVRGKVMRFFERPGGFGITPACAGKSDLRSDGIAVNEDHPRMCGEKTKKIP